MPDKRLSKGDKAPQFEAKDTYGKTVNLKDFANKHVLLVFLRYSGCPWCNLTIHRLALEQQRLNKSGCEIITFIQSEPQNIRDNIYGRHQHTPKFSIIPDQKRTHYDQYHIREAKRAVVTSITHIPFWVKSITKGFSQTKLDGDLFLVPASFLIGPGEQKILSAHYSTSFYDHLVFEEIYSHLYAPAAH